MKVDELKLIVKDFATDKVTEHQVLILQRFFLREYFTWLPMRVIAEITGGADHTRVLDAVKAVRSNQKLFSVSVQLRLVIEANLKGKVVNMDSVRLIAKKKRFIQQIRYRY
jgi:hypothetical protein